MGLLQKTSGKACDCAPPAAGLKFWRFASLRAGLRQSGRKTAYNSSLARREMRGLTVLCIRAG
jgi:hypothetical protein